MMEFQRGRNPSEALQIGNSHLLKDVMKIEVAAYKEDADVSGSFLGDNRLTDIKFEITEYKRERDPFQPISDRIFAIVNEWMEMYAKEDIVLKIGLAGYDERGGRTNEAVFDKIIRILDEYKEAYFQKKL